jgi:hypothetical protein
MPRSRSLLPSLLLVAAILAPLPAGGAGDDPISLRLRPVKGTRWNQGITFTQRLSMQGLRGSDLLARNLVMAIAFEVTEATRGGGAVITGTYLSLFYSQVDLAGKVTWDSENPAADVPRGAANLVPLLGRSFTVTVTREGGLDTIEGADPVVTAFVRGLFPQGAVRLGQAWKHSMVTPGSTPLTIDASMYLDQRSAGTVRQQMVARFRQAPGSPPVDFGSVVQATGVQGSVDGPIALNLESGWPVSARLAYRLTGTVSLNGSLRIPLNLSAPLAGEGEIILEMI